MASSLRDYVIRQWVDAGAPAWTEQQSLEQTKAADRVLERHAENPAPKFRGNRLAENQVYMGQWVYGCKFPWIEMQRLGFTWKREGH